MKNHFLYMTDSLSSGGEQIFNQRRKTMGLTHAFAAAMFSIAPLCIPAHAAEKDIIDTAIGAGQFKTLAAALDAAGLVATLKGDGPFTVFAPTDDAFSKLPAGTVEALLKPENKQKLVDVLTYHVVPGKLMAAEVAKLEKATTFSGKSIDIRIDGNSVKVNDANVTATDIGATNGVIHVIDKVLMPPQG
jgi:uncharacterized surface protein with fasciclin (FAS1) repeats